MSGSVWYQGRFGNRAGSHISEIMRHTFISKAVVEKGHLLGSLIMREYSLEYDRVVLLQYTISISPHKTNLRLRTLITVTS